MANFNWKIAGAAGEGIKVAGLLLSKTALRSGLFVHGYTEYPSLIRGGHNTFQVLVSQSSGFNAPQIKLDVLVALNDNALTNHLDELTPNTIIITQSDLVKDTLAKLTDRKLNILDIPLSKLSLEAGGGPVLRNVVALGASAWTMNLKLETLQNLLKQTFAKKGDEVVAQNVKAAELGFQHASRSTFKPLPLTIPPAKSETNLYLTGNEALSLGAIAGGMKFYAAYPMTPASSILHYMAAKEKEFGIVVRHGEDEIGVVNMALGAAYAGVRSMVGTAGGGFSLMVEGLGLAGITETPLVIILGMRPGPATGMPTWTSQGDLLFAINASQDEFPRIVFTPGDMQESFTLAKNAQELAEKYHLPVIIMTDKYLGESYFTTSTFPSNHQVVRHSLADTQKLDNLTPFARYMDTQSGISSRPLPGQKGGVHLVNSYEHNPLGYATEIGSEREEQVNKRAKKIPLILKDELFPQPILFGPASAKITLVSWGSNKETILQALKSLPEVNFIHFPAVWPFPLDEFNKLIQSNTRLVSLECNSTGQLAKLIRQETGVTIKDQLLKFDGRPFYPEEILSKLKTL